MELLAAARALAEDVRSLSFASPVTHVYHPLDYAWAPHEDFIRRYGASRGREAVFLGMNPGPWGMAQTGVPFGAVGMARDWLGIRGRVERPADEHPKRPVTGFACRRAEVSGMRLWGWARDRFETPERFFERFYVVNYCPLLFLCATPDGRVANYTPDKLRREERERLEAVCDRHLRRVIEALAPRYVIGVGRFAEARARMLFGTEDRRDDAALVVGHIPHPSPASPVANRGWAEAAESNLRALGVRIG